MLQDTGASYLARRGTQASRVRLTQVCYTANFVCDYEGLQTRARTWSTGSARLPMGSDLARGAGLNPASIARDLISGQWRVVRRARLDGQPAMELQPSPRLSHWGPVRVNVEPMWVDARTYLPLRVGGPATLHGPGFWQEFRYLPATPGNLKVLQVPVPRGFPRSKLRMG